MLKFTFLDNHELNKTNYLRTKKIFDKVVKLINKTLNIKKTYLFDVDIINSKKMLEMNAKYRNINKTTDILSFRMSDSEDKTPSNLLGEIYINHELAKQQADENKKTLIYQLAYLFIHGVLHLLNYDHVDQKSYKKMFTLQDKLIKHLF
ncbi:MAG: rRNA maturation RNase YbeY [Mycoplasmataceae bacterium]|jgi:probable rRNA maturation factor|nr:rRNA maturation RNase YbeY [Mycoplasmataceae bacterium]